MANIRKGSFTLDGYKFPLDPMRPKVGGKYIPLSQVKIETLTGNIIQTWESDYSDIEQEFSWDWMDTDFFDELKERYDEHLTDSNTTHELIYHRLNDETWNIIINSLDGYLDRGYNMYSNVRLKFTLINQVLEEI